MRRLMLVVFFATQLLVLGSAISNSGSNEPDASDADPSIASTSATPTDVLRVGADLFAWNCAVCHGATGGGIAEARLAFPPDHRHCTRCHKPNNQVVMPLSQMTDDHDMFSIGEPPRLRGEGMSATAPAQALFGYVRATMPRYEPGRLSDAEYWMIVAFLADLNQRNDATDEAVAAAMASQD